MGKDQQMNNLASYRGELKPGMMRIGNTKAKLHACKSVEMSVL
jgi:hypothetical protein